MILLGTVVQLAIRPNLSMQIPVPSFEALREKLSAEEEKFRAEMTRATEQLETIRKQVLEQVAVAQKSKEETEFRLKMADEQNNRLNEEVQKLRTDLALQSKLCDQLSDANAKHESNLERLSGERDLTIRDLAVTAGRQVAQTEQIKSLERRALSAELRLEKEMKRRARPQKKHGA
jgi:hypothetical protein